MFAQTDGPDFLDERRAKQREYGICSNPDCDEPIEGWCATCDDRGPFKAPKLCAGHLLIHIDDAGHELYSLRLNKRVGKSLVSREGGAR